MESIRELFRIGPGPSSSHTIGPSLAAVQFRGRHPGAARFRVSLYGALAATGKGHLTDLALAQAFAPLALDIAWLPEQILPLHTNGMLFQALDAAGRVLGEWRVYSVGGGALREENAPPSASLYAHGTMEAILAHCQEQGLTFWEYVDAAEGPSLLGTLANAWSAMRSCMERGLSAEGVLPGGLGVARRARALHRKARMSGPQLNRTGLVAAYALAAAEENAAGHTVVTAPTCGSCGVVPAVLRYLAETLDIGDSHLGHALATAGLVGNLVKHNASISGAEVGCQGEVGTACAMAAAAAAELLGGSIHQVEYAAEMGLEHHLGLTCDPVAGLVQIPCIERNAMAATRALTCADYALLSDGTHRISFDDVVTVMRDTGHDLLASYRETAVGGLAAAYRRRHAPKTTQHDSGPQ
jgi:L-serine dehydratase